jgi:hypothetical protein
MLNNSLLTAGYVNLRKRYPHMTALQAVKGLKTWIVEFGEIECIRFDEMVFGTTTVQYWELWWSPAVRNWQQK